MKKIFILYLMGVTILEGCGRGVPVLLGGGECDGYSDSSSSVYILPFASGTTHSLGQGNCSTMSHYGASRYAYDISMDIGTTIIAARAGSVVDVIQSNTDGNGCGPGRANLVSIQHSDGTIADYLHLTNNGSKVKIGDSVTQGQSIALSGLTGCTTGPHLHFQVRASNSNSNTIPITFSNTTAQPKGLEVGISYTAN